ncbi:MAG: YegS/Rv2252/BmrU family lipid kinase [Oscillatoria sp. PMC 1068.18]|nr:YegS/Rv2252/BmrU family lipid kinase [Oscillatoria sp. PMC 1068.18]
MKRPACLVFNPVAGKSNAEEDLQKIRVLLEPEFDLDIRQTTKEKNANQIASEAIADGATLIIASGGDGTLSSAADAVINTGIPIGVISRGTANAFAAALGIPNTIEDACQTIIDGQEKVVDAAKCNGTPMVLLAGIGFEAETIEKTDREQKSRFGILAYILAGFKQLRELEPFEAVLETEDEIIRVTAAAITVANAAPPTSILAQGPAGILADDGLLDVTVVAPQSTTQAIAASYHLLRTAIGKTPAEREDIGYLRTKKIKISTDPPQQVVLDGDLLGTTPLEVECLEKAITLLVPKPENSEPPSAEKLTQVPPGSK